MFQSRRTAVIAVLAGWLFGAIAPAVTHAAETDDIRLAGSSTIAPVMLEIAKLFEQSGDAPRVFVETGGSSKGIIDLRKGLANIAMVSRPLKPREADLSAHIIARDGIAALLHAKNPVTEISKQQLRAIFTGDITNWAELGGTDSDIIVISKGEGRATSVVFNAFLEVTADQIRGDLVAAENAQMIKTVSLIPDSIGYVSIGAALMDMSFGVPVKLVALGPVAATLENVANDSYTAIRPLNLVTEAEVSPSIRDLIEFSSTEAVSSIIRDLSYTPVTQ